MTDHPAVAVTASIGPTEADARIQRLGTAVLVLSGLFTLLTLVGGVIAILVSRRVESRDVGDLGLLDSFGFTTGLVALLCISLPLWLVTAQWLRAVRGRLLDHRWHVKHGPVAIYLCWVIPIVNLFLPFAVVRDLHDTAVGRLRAPSLGLWWALWLAFVAVDRVSTRLYVTQGLGDPAEGIVVTTTVSVLLLVGALLAWVQVVRRTTAAASGGPPPA